MTLSDDTRPMVLRPVQWTEELAWRALRVDPGASRGAKQAALDKALGEDGTTLPDEMFAVLAKAGWLDGGGKRSEDLRYDPQQPRDPGGKGGGQWTKQPAPASGLPLHLFPEEAPHPDIVPGPVAKEVLKGKETTKALHSGPGGYKAERRKRHDRIVGKELASAVASAFPAGHPIVRKLDRGEPLTAGEKAEVRAAVQEHRDGPPRILLTGGGPASGKSSALEQTDVPPDAVHIDSDKIKEQLPEYQEMTARGEPYASSGVHAESADLAIRMTAEARDLGLNMVLDTTGDSRPGKFAKKVRAMKKRGYQTSVLYTTISTDKAVQRALKRGREQGRWVPPDYTRWSHAQVSKVFPEIVALPEADEVSLYDNNTPHAPARLVLTRTGGELKVHDPELYQEFLAKAEGQGPEPSEPDTPKGRGVQEYPADRGAEVYTSRMSTRESESWDVELPLEPDALDGPTPTYEDDTEPRPENPLADDSEELRFDPHQPRDPGGQGGGQWTKGGVGGDAAKDWPAVREGITKLASMGRGSLPTDVARRSHDHGEKHWRDVAAVGVALIAAGVPADPEVVMTFGALHDTQRENEYIDPEHGARAAAVATRLRQQGHLDYLSDSQFADLHEALVIHTGHGVRGGLENPNVAASLDADRLNLWRVNQEPDLAFMSSQAWIPKARLEGLKMDTFYRDVSVGASWKQILDAAEAGKAPPIPKEDYGKGTLGHIQKDYGKGTLAFIQGGGLDDS